MCQSMHRSNIRLRQQFCPVTSAREGQACHPLELLQRNLRISGAQQYQELTPNLEEEGFSLRMSQDAAALCLSVGQNYLENN